MMIQSGIVEYPNLRKGSTAVCLGFTNVVLVAAIGLSKETALCQSGGFSWWKKFFLSHLELELFPENT